LKISGIAFAADQSALPLTKEQRTELDGRLAAYKADGVKGRIVNDVIAEMKSFGP
jgi:putative addiction module component (TIGR02574 family)